MNRYEKGFLTKCAEYGVDGRELLEKIAQTTNFTNANYDRYTRNPLSDFRDKNFIDEYLGYLQSIRHPRYLDLIGQATEDFSIPKKYNWYNAARAPWFVQNMIRENTNNRPIPSINEINRTLDEFRLNNGDIIGDEEARYNALNRLRRKLPNNVQEPVLNPPRQYTPNPVNPIFKKSKNIWRRFKNKIQRSTDKNRIPYQSEPLDLNKYIQQEKKSLGNIRSDIA